MDLSPRARLVTFEAAGRGRTAHDAYDGFLVRLAMVHPSFCAPHTIDSISAYGEESKSNPSNGDCENALPSPFANAALMSSAVNVFSVGDACDPASLVFRFTLVVIRSNRSRADTERVMGVASSFGSTSL